MPSLNLDRLSATLNRVHGISEPVDGDKRRSFLRGAGLLVLGVTATSALSACALNELPATTENIQGSVERTLINMVEAALDKIVRPGTRIDGQEIIPTITIKLPSGMDDHTKTLLSVKVNIEGGEQTVYIIPDLGGSYIDNDGEQLVVTLKAHMWLAKGNLFKIENQALVEQIMSGTGVTNIKKLSPKTIWDKHFPPELDQMVRNPGVMRFDRFSLTPGGRWQFNADQNAWSRPVTSDQGTNLAQ